MPRRLVTTTRWSGAETRQALTTAGKCKEPAREGKHNPRSAAYGYNAVKLLIRVWHLVGQPTGKYSATTVARMSKSPRDGANCLGFSGQDQTYRRATWARLAEPVMNMDKNQHLSGRSWSCAAVRACEPASLRACEPSLFTPWPLRMRSPGGQRKWQSKMVSTAERPVAVSPCRLRHREVMQGLVTSNM